MSEANAWFYRSGGKDFGPVSPATIRELAATGRIEASTLIRKGSDGAWVTAKTVKGLSFPADINQFVLAEEVVASVPSKPSNLISCADCGEMVSRRAPACPKCGCPVLNTIPPALPTRETDPTIDAAIPPKNKVTTPRANSVLVMVALILPVLSGIGLCFVTSLEFALSISFATIVITALLVSIDASLLGRVDKKGKKREVAGVLFVAICLLWIVVYPLAFFRRQRFARPNLGFVSLAVAVFFLVLPILGTLLIPRGLPSCTSSDVSRVLEKVIRSTAAGTNLKSLDGFREISYDQEKSVRQGECVAHTTTGDIPIKFVVEWQDKSTGRFQVRIPPEELPTCNSPDVAKLLEQVLRGFLVNETLTLKSVDGHREISFDQRTNVRLGECVAHTSAGDVPIRFVVEWQDRNKGLFQVRTIPIPD